MLPHPPLLPKSAVLSRSVWIVWQSTRKHWKGSPPRLMFTLRRSTLSTAAVVLCSECCTKHLSQIFIVSRVSQVLFRDYLRFELWNLKTLYCIGATLQLRLLEKVVGVHKHLTNLDETMMELYQKGLVDGFKKELLAYE